jgi:hypothetical protein
MRIRNPVLFRKFIILCCGFNQVAPRPGFIWSPESGNGSKKEFRKLLNPLLYVGSEVDHVSFYPDPDSYPCFSYLNFKD